MLYLLFFIYSSYAFQKSQIQQQTDLAITTYEGDVKKVENVAYYTDKIINVTRNIDNKIESFGIYYSKITPFNFIKKTTKSIRSTATIIKYGYAVQHVYEHAPIYVGKTLYFGLTRLFK